MYVENRIAGVVIVNVMIGEDKITNKERIPMYSITGEENPSLQPGMTPYVSSTKIYFTP